MRWKKLKHRFVRHLPETLEPGVLYVSTEYATVSHSCCCGCGEEVVTPLSPVGWRIIFDGETISLWPSVGNWQLRCRSHYVIERGDVIEAGPWSDEQVEAERRRDRAAKERHFGRISVAETAPPAPVVEPAPPPPVDQPSVAETTRWWVWLWQRVFGPYG